MTSKYLHNTGAVFIYCSTFVVADLFSSGETIKANSLHSILLTLHLLEDSLRNSSCCMPEMLKSDIILALTLSAGCKCYYTYSISLHRHVPRSHLHSRHMRLRERCHVIYVITHPSWLTPWKILDLFVWHVLRIVQDSQRLPVLYFIREASSVYNMTLY